MAVNVARRPARHRWSLRLVVALLALAAIWSGLWRLAAVQAGSAFEHWTLAEAAAGRLWTCPGRRVEGYPVALRLSCDQPTYHGEVAGRIVDGQLDGVLAGVRLDHPLTVAVTLRGPLNLRDVDETFDLAVSWAALSLTVEGLSDRPSGGSLDTTRLAVTLQTRQQGDLNLRAAHLSGRASPAPSSPDDAAFVVSAAGVVFPTLDALPGLDQPMDADGQGTLVQAHLLREPSLARLEAWRIARGELRLGDLSIVKGEFHGQAHGQIGLDALHRPAGRLETTLSGFEPIAAHFGIPLAGVKLGGLLTNLLGGHPKATADGSVQLPLVFADGHLAVGPFTTPVRLDPFY